MDLYREIDKLLIATKNGQQHKLEYRYILDLILKKTPCNLLIFGCGKDTNIWYDSNLKGHTVFLEDSDVWIKTIKKDGNKRALDIIHVQYNTKRPDYNILLDNISKLKMSLPQRILDIKWDLILVDAPKGNKDDHPGRMQSIYTSSLIGKEILIHDCNRPVEDIYTKKYCGTLIKELDTPKKLRHYKNLK